MSDVLVVGVAVADFVFQVDEIPTAARKYRATNAEIVGGGCAANAAVAIARLGGNARLGARLGDDPVGALIVEDLAREGVDTTLVQIEPGARSSYSSIYVDRDGERQIMNFRGADLPVATDWISAAEMPAVVLADTRWTEGAMAAMALAKRKKVPGVLDAEAPMERHALQDASHVAFSRDGLLSLYEGADLTLALAAAASDLGCWVAVTDGSQGTWFIDKDGLHHEPATTVEAVDTLGAGDVWHGAFALALAEGQSEAAAVRFSNVTAALKCTKFGGRKGSPDREAVESILKGNQT